MSFESKFVQIATFFEAWRAFLNHKERDTMGFRSGSGISDCNNYHHIGQDPVGNEDFAAVQNVIISVFFGPSPNALQIRTSIRFCHANSTNEFTRSHFRDVVILLLGSSVMSKVGHDNS